MIPTKEKLLKAYELTEGGEAALIDAIISLEEKVEDCKSLKKGDKGDDYVLTDEDRADIASKIEVPVVEKVIEKTTEVIREQPIVKTEIIKETIERQPIETKITQTVERPITPKEVVDNLNETRGLVDPAVLRGWEDLERIIRANSHAPRDFDLRIGVSQTDFQNLLRRVITVEQGGTGGVGAWSTPAETPNGSIQTFTVGSEAPTDVVADGVNYYSGAGYTFAGGQITFTDIQPVNFVRYR
jgi:hypothetical protein